jgi:hypothetical protein
MDFVGLIQKFPVNRPLSNWEINRQLRPYESKTDKPRGLISVIKMNSTYLECVDKFFANKGFLSAFGITASAMITFVLMFSTFGIAFKWSSISPGSRGEALFAIIASSIMCSGALILFLKMTLSKELFRFTHYPIRFNRRNRMVYVTRLDGTVMAESWDKLFFTERVGGGEWEIRGHRLAEDGITVLETFALPVITTSKNPYRFAFWEFVRRYMEDGPQKLMTRVEWTIDVSERREGFWQGFRFHYIDAASLLGDFAFILFPVILWYAAGRWIAMRTSKIPRWPQELEAQCRIDPNDPYVMDQDRPPQRVDPLDDSSDEDSGDQTTVIIPVAPSESLHEAVWNGNWGTARRLLQQGAEVNQVNPEGKTALDLARARGDKVIIDLLLTHGATDRQASQGTPPA